MTLTLTQDPDTQTWPKYGQDVLAYQKSSFYVKGFKSYSLNRQKHGHTERHTDRHNWKHYLHTYMSGNEGPSNSEMLIFEYWMLIHFEVPYKKIGINVNSIFWLQSLDIINPYQ